MLLRGVIINRHARQFISNPLLIGGSQMFSAAANIGVLSEITELVSFYSVNF
jgi:hypothetical protein